MYISVVTVFVSDIDRAVDFYTKTLGWDLTMDVAMGEGMRWVTVQPKGGQAQFTISTGEMGGEKREPGGFSGVIMEVDDVFKTHDELSKKGVAFEEPPRKEPWGGWASFKDSEGNVHGLHSPAA